MNGVAVGGTAWLDHEWSSAYLAPEARGWDWAGINFLNGASLMGFRMRDRSGGAHYAPPGISMKPLRVWQSPRTGVEYPVSMQLNDLRLEPLMDDQELDSRAEHRHDLLGRRGPGFQKQRPSRARLPRAHWLLETDEALSDESVTPARISAMPAK